MSSTQVPLNVIKSVGYLSAGAVAMVLLTKTIIRNRKDKQFLPAARQLGDGTEVEDPYGNIAAIKPGFPMQQEQRPRKSEFEGAGLSYRTRKSGDRLGFFDRRQE